MRRDPAAVDFLRIEDLLEIAVGVIEGEVVVRDRGLRRRGRG